MALEVDIEKQAGSFLPPRAVTAQYTSAVARKPVR